MVCVVDVSGGKAWLTVSATVTFVVSGAGSGLFPDGMSNDPVTFGRSIPGANGHIAWSLPGTQAWLGGAAQAKVVLAVLPMLVVFLEVYQYWLVSRGFARTWSWMEWAMGARGRMEWDLRDCLPIVPRVCVYVGHMARVLVVQN